MQRNLYRIKLLFVTMLKSAKTIFVDRRAYIYIEWPIKGALKDKTRVI